jgi:HAD superfamily hydrolase (TIGR01662 family)
MDCIPEIVVVAGPPGSGKSSSIQEMENAGYVRINRDLLGGSLKDSSNVYQEMWRQFTMGKRAFVLDNVYATKESRAQVLEIGRDMGLPVRMIWIDASAEQAQFFAARRQVQRYGHVLRPAEYKQKPYKDDPNMFPPAAQFAYWKRVERPEVAEGFTSVVFQPVTITLGSEYVNKAVIFDYDGTLRVTKSGRHSPRDPADVQVLPGRAEKIRKLVAEGYLILGASNQSAISKDPSDSEYLSEADAIACFNETNRQLGLPIHVLYSTERGGVPQSYLPKPCPGMGAQLIEQYKLDPAQCLYVGDMTKDATFAKRCGFQFKLANEFFA